MSRRQAWTAGRVQWPVYIAKAIQKNCKMPENFGKREPSSRKAKKLKVSASDMTR